MGKALLLVLDSITKRTIQLRRLKTEGLQIEHTATMLARFSFEGTDQAGTYALPTMRGLYPKLLKFAALPREARTTAKPSAP